VGRWGHLGRDGPRCAAFFQMLLVISTRARLTEMGDHPGSLAAGIPRHLSVVFGDRASAAACHAPKFNPGRAGQPTAWSRGGGRPASDAQSLPGRARPTLLRAAPADCVFMRAGSRRTIDPGRQFWQLKIEDSLQG